mmetsp:Transcript_30621/g.78162  ORF Transcript_30621/g.78162 Transcript_30621/m.78162 type:complete len:261 (+) Transcript_30621:21-803(+)
MQTTIPSLIMCLPRQSPLTQLQLSSGQNHLSPKSPITQHDCTPTQAHPAAAMSGCICTPPTPPHCSQHASTPSPSPFTYRLSQVSAEVAGSAAVGVARSGSRYLLEQQRLQGRKARHGGLAKQAQHKAHAAGAPREVRHEVVQQRDHLQARAQQRQQVRVHDERGVQRGADGAQVGDREGQPLARHHVPQLLLPPAQLREARHDEHAAQREAQRELGGGQDDDGQEEQERERQHHAAARQEREEVGELLRAGYTQCLRAR